MVPQLRLSRRSPRSATSPTSPPRWSPSSPSDWVSRSWSRARRVGKTKLAKALSRATDRELIRLQCYEGLDEAKALYEWNYRKQLLRIQAGGEDGWEDVHGDIFDKEFLLSAR